MRVVAKSEVDRKILLLMEETGNSAFFEETCDSFCKNCQLSETRNPGLYKSDEIPVQRIFDQMVQSYMCSQAREYLTLMRTN